MKVLFVCIGNLCRSPLAAAYFQKILNERNISSVEVSSAGLWAVEGNTPEGMAYVVGEEVGIDLSNHRARVLEPDDVNNTDLILVMERFQMEDVIKAYPEAKDKVKLLRSFARDGAIKTDIADAYGLELADYKECFTDIKESVEGLYKYLKVHKKI